MTPRIIFVCSGNICRSPLAAGMAKAKLDEAGVASVIISAGTLQLTGKPAASNSVAAGAAIGVDISSHRSQGLTRPLMERADYLVVMSPSHAAFISKHVPSATSKVVRLWDYVDGYDQIADPVGMDLDAFVECRDLMDRALDEWIRTEWGS